MGDKKHVESRLGFGRLPMATVPDGFVASYEAESASL